MATIHISRDKAAADFDGLMARVGHGDQIVIEEDASPIAVLAPAAKPHVRLLSESLRIARESASTATLDRGFEKDLTEIIEASRQPLIDPWA